MKFQRYCYQSDIDIESPNCRYFTNNNFYGYVVDEKFVYLSISGMPNVFCLFTNNEAVKLSDEYLFSWAQNTSVFIKETIGSVVNLKLSLEVPTFLNKLKLFQNGEDFNTQNVYMYSVSSKPIIELKKLDASFFITIDGKPLYCKGITNEKFAKEIYKKLSDDISQYIKKRWPIE